MRYACVRFSGKKLAECVANSWLDAVSKFTKMGYSLYKCDIIRIEEGNYNDED